MGTYQKEDMFMAKCTLGAMSVKEIIDFLGFPSAKDHKLPDLGRGHYYCAMTAIRHKESLSTAVNHMTTPYDDKVWMPIYIIGRDETTPEPQWDVAQLGGEALFLGGPYSPDVALDASYGCVKQEWNPDDCAKMLLENTKDVKDTNTEML